MDEDDLCVYGTPLAPLDEDNIHLAKAQKLSDQVATDKQGRRRFHGAFTGGFSAGYFNSVGSKEGWTPSTFVSSRSKRSQNASANDAIQYMDDEDLDHFGIGRKQIQAKANYDDEPRHFKRKRVEESSGPIPGKPVLHDLLKPTTLTIGMKLLMKLGWKQGQGIGPRISKQEKRRARNENNVYGDTWSKGDNVNQSDSDDETEHMNLAYAPDDVEISLFHGAKINQFGLGYKPLDRHSILGRDFDDYAKTPSLRIKEKNKTVAIRGHAFGTGVFEDDDDDIYSREDMSSYDFSLGHQKEVGNKKKKSASRWQTHISLMGEVLEGFHLSSKPLPKTQAYPIPTLPSGYKPFHQTNRRRFDTQDNERKSRLTAEERRKMTSNPPSVEVRSGVKRAEGLISEPISQDSQRHHYRESTKTSSNFTNSFSALGDKVKSLEPTSAYAPFASFPEKQERYEDYLRVRDKGNVQDIFSSTMTEWEKEREKEEFSKVASRVVKPFAVAMSSRFTSAVYGEKKDNLKEGLNNMTEKKTELSVECHPSLSYTDESKADDDTKAARGKMFGKLTQTSYVWHPDKILCRRFNVPHPFPESSSVGVSNKPKEKICLFSFLPSATSSLSYETEAATTGTRKDNERVSLNKENREELKEENLLEHNEESAEDYGLKVPVTNPPTLDLFKAIFQDSSDSENEDSDAVKPDLHKIDSNRLLQIEKPAPEFVPSSMRKVPTERRFSKHVSKSDFKDDSKQESSEQSKSAFGDSRLISKAKGIFKGIDFASINEYRSVDNKKEESVAVPNTKSNRTDVQHDKLDSSSNVSSEDDEDSYIPSLPPHMMKNTSQSVELSLPPKSSKELSSSEKSSSFYSGISSTQKHKKEKKNKKKQSHKHKKKYKKEKKRR